MQQCLSSLEAGSKPVAVGGWLTSPIFYFSLFLQINIIQGIVAEINTKTGESECRYYKERLLYLEEGQKDSLIDSSRVLCCHGELKNNRGVVSNSSPQGLTLVLPLPLAPRPHSSFFSLIFFFFFFAALGVLPSYCH